MLNDFSLEKIERQYFDLILLHLKQELNTLIEGLNSRIKILNDWYQSFIKTARKGSCAFPILKSGKCGVLSPQIS